jgi:hypothetical protein
VGAEYELLDLSSLPKRINIGVYPALTVTLPLSSVAVKSWYYVSKDITIRMRTYEISLEGGTDIRAYR